MGVTVFSDHMQMGSDVVSFQTFQQPDPVWSQTWSTMGMITGNGCTTKCQRRVKRSYPTSTLDSLTVRSEYLFQAGRNASEQS